MFEEPAPRQSLSLDLLGSRALPRLFLPPLLFLAACSLPPSKVQLTPSPASEGRVSQTGIASWYGPGFHGKATASGAIYDQNDLTAAHQTLPLGTRVMVTNLETGSSAEVTINDRGPFAKGRIIDLSYGAGKALGMIGPGTIPVRVEVLGAPSNIQSIRTSLDYTLQVGSFSKSRMRNSCGTSSKSPMRTFPSSRCKQRMSRIIGFSWEPSPIATPPKNGRANFHRQGFRLSLWRSRWMFLTG